MTPFIRLHPADDVLIARSQLVGGASVENVSELPGTPLPCCHARNTAAPR